MKRGALLLDEICLHAESGLDVLMLLTISTTATGHMENLNLDMDSSELQLYYLSICMVGCKDGCVNSVEICHPSNDGSTQMFLHG